MVSCALATLCGLALFVAGCTIDSCGEEANVESDDPTRWAEKSELASFVPSSARVAVFARDLETFADTLSFGAQRLPADVLGRAERVLSVISDADALDGDAFEEIGLSPRAPAVVFHDRGYWTIAVGLDRSNRLERALREAGANEGVERTRAEFGSFSADYLRVDGEPEASAIIARGEQRALISLPVQAEIDRDDPRLPSTWQPDSQRSRFLDDQRRRELLGQMSGVGEVVGVVRPATWLADMRADGQAEVLRQQLMTQTGPVGFGFNAASLGESAQLQVVLPRNPEAPQMVPDLGEADGDLPSLGGLVEPGVLGVGRVSADPESLYRLFVSAMPAERRRDIDDLLERLDEELRVDVERDVLDTLRGHAVIVAYGLKREAFDSGASPWLLELAKLEPTREAVLMPIHEREPLERVLDAWTTVSKSKLSRQKSGHTLQYAWIEEGTLEWAFILSDDYLVFVDSAVAFEHAAAFEERAGPMDDELEERGLDRLFAGEYEAGLYLDAATLTDILAEVDQKRAARWLAPFDSLVVTSRTDGGSGVVDAEFQMGGADKRTGEERGGGEE